MVVLLNGSLRGEKSNSNYFLNRFAELLEQPFEKVHLLQYKEISKLVAVLEKADALVIGMPLYVDGVPAQIVELMEILYQRKKKRLEGLHVYVITNLGFYESRQAQVLLSIVKNWCKKMEMVYGGAVAIGGGEMMGSMSGVPLDKGPNQKMGQAMVELAESVNKGTVTEDMYVEPTAFPAFLYKLAADSGWGRAAKRNGISQKDLKKKRP